MKRNIKLILTMLLGMSTLCLNAQDGKTDPKSVAESIEQKEYTIDVDWAMPSSGRNVNLTPSYTFKVSKDSVYTHLPFFGRSYNSSYNEEVGITMESPLENYSSESVEKRNKNMTKISFKARYDGCSYDIKITIYPSGEANIYISPSNKSSISYRGQMVL